MKNNYTLKTTKSKTHTVLTSVHLSANDIIVATASQTSGQQINILSAGEYTPALCIECIELD